jgi:hypothetical protein
MLTLWVSKDSEFYVDLKNINYLSDKMHLKKVIPKNVLNWNFYNT